MLFVSDCECLHPVTTWSAHNAPPCLWAEAGILWCSGEPWSQDYCVVGAGCPLLGYWQDILFMVRHHWLSLSSCCLASSYLPGLLSCMCAFCLFSGKEELKWPSPNSQVFSGLFYMAFICSSYRFYPWNSFQLGVPFVEIDHQHKLDTREVNGNDVTWQKIK